MCRVLTRVDCISFSVSGYADHPAKSSTNVNIEKRNKKENFHKSSASREPFSRNQSNLPDAYPDSEKSQNLTHVSVSNRPHMESVISPPGILFYALRAFTKNFLLRQQSRRWPFTDLPSSGPHSSQSEYRNGHTTDSASIPILLPPGYPALKESCRPRTSASQFMRQEQVFSGLNEAEYGIEKLFTKYHHVARGVVVVRGKRYTM